MKTRLALSSLAFAAATAVASGAWANQYFVAPDGGDCNPGSMSSPWSLGQAVSATGAQAGDTVWLRGGTYSAGPYQVTNSGTASAWITFEAYPGELPILDGGGMGGVGFGGSLAEYVKVIGIVSQNFSASGFGNGWTDAACATMSNSNWQFINDVADNNGINGITMYCAQGLFIDESIVAHNGNMDPSFSSGVSLYHTFGDHTTNIIQRTVSFENIDISAHNSDGSGFILDQDATGATFQNNIGFRNGGSCIRANCPDMYMINNTCYHDGIDPNDATGTGPTEADEIFFTYGLQGIMVNNLLAASGYDNKGIGINMAGGSNNYSVNDDGATPFFVNPTAFDFHLTSSASVAIDKGTATNAPSTDIGFDPKCLESLSGQAVSWWTTGVNYTYIASVGGVAGCFHPSARPVGSAPDIGAYEYGGKAIAGTGGAAPSGESGTAGAGGGAATCGTATGGTSGSTGGTSGSTGGTSGSTGGTSGSTGGTSGSTGGTSGSTGGTSGSTGGTSGSTGGTSGSTGGTSGSAGGTSGSTGGTSGSTGGTTGNAGTGGTTGGQSSGGCSYTGGIAPHDGWGAALALLGVASLRRRRRSRS
jgi:MYXO-CTERM domain-containing protein